MDGLRFSYFGAEPCVGSKMAQSSPMFALLANPNPPTSPEKASLMMSPNMLLVTMTP